MNKESKKFYISSKQKGKSNEDMLKGKNNIVNMNNTEGQFQLNKEEIIKSLTQILNNENKKEEKKIEELFSFCCHVLDRNSNDEEAKRINRISLLTQYLKQEWKSIKKEQENKFSQFFTK
jgi:flagellin-specific chaperone FliS